MKNYGIFVYGTLKKGFYNYQKYLENEVKEVTEGFIYATLYRLKGEKYPGAIPCKENQISKVYGQIMYVSEETLKKLDEMEEFYGVGNFENTYNRKKAKVYSVKDDSLLGEFDMYFYNVDNPKFAEKLDEVIESGNF